tara:strand:- start:4187 stop:4609 length:423 start_codon:yes stop_codon:yes gene_type:complete
MAKKLGQDFRLFVRDVGGATFSQPRGQGNLTINRSSSPIDTSTKDSGRYGTSAPGAKTLTLSQELIPDLPDATGYTRMKALDGSGDAEVYQIREKPFAEEDAVFECLMYTVFGNTGLGRTDAVGTSVELSAAEAPTVDDI